MRKFLIFVPAGDKSLHTAWFNPSRNFDICVNYYGTNKDKEEEYRQKSDYFFTNKGYAYELLIRAFMSNAELKEHEFIQKIDDDIDISTEDLNTCFEMCQKYDFKMAQPSLYPKNYCYKHLVNVKDSDYRYVDFIEIQMPIWSKNFFKYKIYPVLMNNQDVIKCGWGLDILMSYLAGFSGMAVIDKAKAKHMKPITMGSWYLKMPISPFIEEILLLKRYRVKKFYCDKNGVSNIKLKRMVTPPMSPVNV